MVLDLSLKADSELPVRFLEGAEQTICVGILKGRIASRLRFKIYGWNGETDVDFETEEKGCR